MSGNGTKRFKDEPFGALRAVGPSCPRTCAHPRRVGAEKRKNEATRILAKYPERIPVRHARPQAPWFRVLM